MGMYDESWCASCGESMRYTPDEDAFCGRCATEIGEELVERIIMFIQTKYDEHEHELSEILNQVDNEQDGHYTLEQANMQDYHEGAVEALGVVLHKVKDMYQNG